MQIEFTPAQEALVKNAIRSGRLTRAEDAVRQALSLWEENERNRLEILSALEESEADMESGDFAEYTSETTPQLLAELKAEGRAMRDRNRAKSG
jgi:Arc/MetJ-type ribon-helix-helix transcriptional regulator